jgi:Protein of unknown function (DUF5818)
MNRAALPFGFLALLMTAFLSAQDSQPKPQVPEDAFTTRQLIAWSSLQNPQPMPQPLPPPDKAVPNPGPQQSKSAAPGSSASASQSQQSRTFVGKILKNAGAYVLKVDGGTEYQLKSAGDLSSFDNKNVKIAGELDLSGTAIEVAHIEIVF